MEMVGKRDVDGFDRRVVEQVLVGAVPAGIESRSAASSARSGERDAIASTRLSAERCIPGMTLLTAIPATPSTPHRTGSFASSMSPIVPGGHAASMTNQQSSGRRPGSLQASPPEPAPPWDLGCS